MPDWKAVLSARLGALRLRPERYAEMLEELSQHLDARFDELCAEGLEPAEAERQVRQEADAAELPERLQELRQARQPQAPELVPAARAWWQDIFHDLRYALFALRRQPGFALVAILTLALGIGANAAIFALVDATVLRPLPLPEPERALFLAERTEAAPRSNVSPLNMRDWAGQSSTLEAVGGYLPNVASMVMSSERGGENVARQWVSAGVFSALGLQALQGRGFTLEDDRSNADVVVLSESFWRSRFGADPQVIGRSLSLDGKPFTVLGVMPQAATLIGRSDVWALVSLSNIPPRARGAYVLNVVARMKPGVEIEAARADLDSVAAGLAQQYPDTNRGRSVHVESLHSALVGGDLRRTSMLFLAVVGLVLLVCCANIANLLLARASARSRELAIRAALGASRGRVMRQLLTESVLLAALGGALGLLLGAAILNVAPSLLPQDLLPRAVELQVDGRLVGFCLLVALGTGLLFGLAPAWQAGQAAPVQAIGAEGRGLVSGGGRLRGALVIGQVAIAVALLVAGGLLLRSLMALDSVERGYAASNVLTLMVDPLGSRYPTDADILRFYDEVSREVREVPAVRNAAWATTLPMGASSFGDAFFSVEGGQATDPQARPTADYQIVSEGYFDTVEVPILAGRGFDRRDDAQASQVAVISEAFARKHFSSGADLNSVLGRRIAVQTSSAADAPQVLREVIGVAGQVKARADEREDFVQLYVPLRQSPVGDIYLLVRPHSGEAGWLAPPVFDAVRRIDTEQLVSLREVNTLENIASEGTARHRFRAVLVGSFAALVLVLAMIGVFGVLAYTVEQRRREYGLRMALGAPPAKLLWLVGRHVAGLLAAGFVLGLLAALPLGRALQSLLFEVTAFDPLTLLAVVLLLISAAVLATIAPAWQALRVDPAVSLRGS
ncbi:ABC transporter permease [Pseudomarimonas arenosa]|uniref:ABC transporter permease n=1 Tax=Pseudomarimonas arenosa TaxID=2774145 RepID=A0AAW3ZDI0_9GAMM|nr:ABC transporter permease [Pseudomarimonas arenosa]MBD8524268.1 ABC transporter permease [Pseudomarimonas arenosa]